MWNFRIRQAGICLTDICLKLDLMRKSEINRGMCSNGIMITGLQEFDYDISGGFSDIDRTGFPLSMIVQGKKQ